MGEQILRREFFKIVKSPAAPGPPPGPFRIYRDPECETPPRTPNQAAPGDPQSNHANRSNSVSPQSNRSNRPPSANRSRSADPFGNCQQDFEFDPDVEMPDMESTMPDWLPEGTPASCGRARDPPCGSGRKGNRPPRNPEKDARRQLAYSPEQNTPPGMRRAPAGVTWEVEMSSQNNGGRPRTSRKSGFIPQNGTRGNQKNEAWDIPNTPKQRRVENSPRRAPRQIQQSEAWNIPNTPRKSGAGNTSSTVSISKTTQVQISTTSPQAGPSRSPRRSPSPNSRSRVEPNNMVIEELEDSYEEPRPDSFIGGHVLMGPHAGVYALPMDALNQAQSQFLPEDMPDEYDEPEINVHENFEDWNHDFEADDAPVGEEGEWYWEDELQEFDSMYDSWSSEHFVDPEDEQQQQLQQQQEVVEHDSEADLELKMGTGPYFNTSPCDSEWSMDSALADYNTSVYGQQKTRSPDQTRSPSPPPSPSSPSSPASLPAVLLMVAAPPLNTPAFGEMIANLFPQNAAPPPQTPRTPRYDQGPQRSHYHYR